LSIVSSSLTVPLATPKALENPLAGAVLTAFAALAPSNETPLLLVMFWLSCSTCVPIIACIWNLEGRETPIAPALSRA